MNRIPFAFLTLCAGLAAARGSDRPFVPIGIFLGRIEEGARIFTPVRLLPFDHPEAQGHQFPNALQLHRTEMDALLWLGHLAGYELRATLMRYPQAPSDDWPYEDFSQPDTSHFRSAECIRRPRGESPLNGLRAVYFDNGQPVTFIVDTRDLTLEERGMTRPSTMGLDIDRAAFVGALERASVFAGGSTTAAVIFGP